jgi:hypothetical protein
MNSPPLLINTSENKHLLIKAISDLSTRIQQNRVQLDESVDKGNYIILKLENDALDHIETIILDVFNSILIAAPDLIDQNGPETDLTNSFITNNNTNKNNSNCAVNSNNYLNLTPIATIAEAELKTRQVLPRNYADEACPKAYSVVEKSRAILKSTNKLIPFLKNSYNTDELLTSQIFAFPIDRINQLLAKIYNLNKFDIYITIFLVAILEYITKDILHLCTCYVRHLNKYSIMKMDISTAIHADIKLARLCFITKNGGININRSESDLMYYSQELNDDDDYDDDRLLNFSTSSSTNNLNSSDSVSNIILPLSSSTSNLLNYQQMGNNEAASSSSSQQQSIVARSFMDNISVRSQDESDSSTLCAESIASSSNLNDHASSFSLAQRYHIKVKELHLEQIQHLNDLNILRRIFMYLFQKFSSQNYDKDSQEQLIENIFGNINEVYEVSLKLTDLIDESLSSSSSQLNVKYSSGSKQQQTVFIGQQFWELAEGAEFNVYSKYSQTVTNYESLRLNLNQVLGNPSINRALRLTNPGLADTSKYLLPRLLVGALYHILYLYETIEYLASLATDHEDKTFLNDTLDTLKPIKFKLEEGKFISSKRRPIESSFRLFQLNQFQPQNSINNLNDRSTLNSYPASFSNTSSTTITTITNNSVSNSACSGSCAISDAATCSSLNSYNSQVPHKIKAFASNVNLVTEKKWKELENNVESFKLPTSNF